jgi:hypothetical protein
MRSPVPVSNQRSGCPGGRESLGANAEAIARWGQPSVVSSGLGLVLIVRNGRVNLWELTLRRSRCQKRSLGVSRNIKIRLFQVFCIPRPSLFFCN